jgi:hypothetical protein
MVKIKLKPVSKQFRAPKSKTILGADFGVKFPDTERGAPITRHTSLVALANTRSKTLSATAIDWITSAIP